MAFTKKIPEWNASGVEPPQSLKDSGWKPGVKPAADHFNWLQTTASEAIKEIQQKAGEVKKVNGQLPDANGNVNVNIDTSKLATKEELSSASTYIQQEMNDLEQTVAAHQTDDTKHVHWIGTATGTNALTASYGAITEYKEGLAVSFKNTVASTAAVSLNINGLGAIPIINNDGEAQTDLKNGVYTVRYSNGNFILQGSQGVSKAAQITSLTATVGFSVAGQVKLDWTFPVDAKRKGIRIVYKTGSYPTNENDGTVFYDSNDATPVTTLTKTGFTDGTKYYFRAFTWTYKNATRVYTTDTTNAQTTATPIQTKGIVTLTSSGSWTPPVGVTSVDAFVVGGGGGGGGSTGTWYTAGGHGGGSGYTKTYKNIPVTPGVAVPYLIGAGGVGGDRSNEIGPGSGKPGGYSYFKDTTYIAGGGSGGPYSAAQTAGGGGSGGGNGGGGYGGSDSRGGSDGSNGADGKSNADPNGGIGQGTTTRAFSEAGNTLYAGGGGGGNYSYKDLCNGGAGGGGMGGCAYDGAMNKNSNPNGSAGYDNTGSGGGGGAIPTDSAYNAGMGGNGGSGVIVVRWGY